MHKQYHKGNTVLQRRRHRDRKSFGYIRFYSWLEIHGMEKTDRRLRGGQGWHMFKNQYGAGFSRDVPAVITYTMVDVARQAMLADRRKVKKENTRIKRRARQMQAYYLKTTGVLRPLETCIVFKPAGYEKRTKALRGVLAHIGKRKANRVSPVPLPGE